MERRHWFLLIGIIGLTFCGFSLRRGVHRNSPNYECLFNEYINKFNKTYKSNETEYNIRMENFKQSLRLIEQLNYNRSTNSSALYGLTVYSDLSQDEFRELRLQGNLSIRSSFEYEFQQVSNMKLSEKEKHKHKYSINSLRTKRAIEQLPSVVDWRSKGVIGAVHNQKTCGACWAFSTIETLESMNAIKNGTFLPLSVQEAIDCARNGNYGCEGGDSCSLLKWLLTTNTKITTASAYPFAYRTQTCRSKPPDYGVQVKSYSCDDFVDSEDLLLEKLANHGPLAAAVNALNWQFYLGGVIQFHCSGSMQDLNHGVQIVGYDKSGPEPHYIIRNSWGPEFGDNGYLYIAIGGNICGIANEVTSLEV